LLISFGGFFGGAISAACAASNCALVGPQLMPNLACICTKDDRKRLRPRTQHSSNKGGPNRQSRPASTDACVAFARRDCCAYPHYLDGVEDVLAVAQALDANALQLARVQPKKNYPVYIIVPAHGGVHVRGVAGVHEMFPLHAMSAANLGGGGGGFWKEKKSGKSRFASNTLQGRRVWDKVPK